MLVPKVLEHNSIMVLAHMGAYPGYSNIAQVCIEAATLTGYKGTYPGVGAMVAIYNFVYSCACGCVKMHISSGKKKEDFY